MNEISTYKSIDYLSEQFLNKEQRVFSLSKNKKKSVSKSKKAKKIMVVKNQLLGVSRTSNIKLSTNKLFESALNSAQYGPVITASEMYHQ